MLDPRKKPKKGNEQGSVLLAVVCMGMMGVTLSSIALSWVNYNTKATARNVERTQAKVTAEACLTEFMNNYLTYVDPDDPENQNAGMDKLIALAGLHSEADYENLSEEEDSVKDTSWAISVSADQTSDKDFEHTYGKTYIYPYECSIQTASGLKSGYKVTCESVFMGQKQTASVVFTSTSNSPYTPTNTLECKAGASFGGAANPMDGDIYVQKQDLPTEQPYMTFHNANGGYHSHVYSQYNIKFDTGSPFGDVTNKTGSTNFQPNKNNAGSSRSGEYFQQACTIRTDGYIYCDNPETISTTCGKTDINGWNRTSAAKEGVIYDENNLSNLDGWICADKKLLMLRNTLQIGDSTNPIDVYCHGAYFGAVPTSLNGLTNTERDEIWAGYQNNIGENPAESSTIHGNVYCYVGTSDNKSDNGDFVVFTDYKTTTIDGDLCVEGNIYIKQGSRINVTGNLYCNNVFVVDGSGNVIESEDGLSLIDAASKNSFSSLDRSDANPRAQYPSVGYTPSTGVQNTERRSLQQIYDDATPNKIFRESFGGPGHDNQAAAGDIAKKYAQALTRTLDDPTYAGGNAVETYSVSGHNVKQISSSIRIRSTDLGGGVPDNANSKIYNIKLTDEDIVLLLPNKTLNGTYFTVDSTERTADVFVYVMYYDEGALTDDGSTITDNCYYLNTTDAPLNSSFSFIDSGTGVTKTVTLNPTSYDSRKTIQVGFGCDNNNVMCFSDVTLWKPWSEDDNITADDYWARVSGAQGKPDVANLSNYAENGVGMENYIMFMLPDNITLKMNDHTSIQGVIYGPDADVEVATASGDDTPFYGQVKCRNFVNPGNFDKSVIYNIPPAKNSLLDYINVNQTTSESVDLQYYQY